MPKALMGIVCVGLLTVACSGGPKAGAAGSGTTAGGGTLSVAAGDFGVPECDSYMKKYIACIDAKVPEAMRAP